MSFKTVIDFRYLCLNNGLPCFNNFSARADTTYNQYYYFLFSCVMSKNTKYKVWSNVDRKYDFFKNSWLVVIKTYIAYYTLNTVFKM